MFLYAVLCFLLGIVAAVLGTSGGPGFLMPVGIVLLLAAMVLLIVALTGILVETTWREPSSSIEVTPPDPGSVARR